MKSRTSRSVEKRVLLTRAENRQLSHIAMQLSEILDCQLSASNIVRALLREFIAHENALVEAAQQSSPLSRPTNGDETGLVTFEEALGEVMVRAFSEGANRPR